MYTVHLAEDDTALLTVCRRKLIDEGYHVEISKDGIETLRLIRESVPDLLILDLGIPLMDGFTVLKEMREDENIKHIPVIVSTNYDQIQDAEKAMGMGARDYLIKSNLSLNEVMLRVKRVLQPQL